MRAGARGRTAQEIQVEISELTLGTVGSDIRHLLAEDGAALRASAGRKASRKLAGVKAAPRVPHPDTGMGHAHPLGSPADTPRAHGVGRTLLSHP